MTIWMCAASKLQWYQIRASNLAVIVPKEHRGVFAAENLVRSR
jgi:hypothetical protein